MGSRATGRTQLANLAGLAGIAVIVVGMVISGVVYAGSLGEPYRLANHFVSELGEIGVSALAVAFNVGLVIGGIGIVTFVVGLVGRLEGWFRWVLGAVGVLTGAFGALVGVFPMNDFATHVVVANGFFYPGLATMLLFSGYVLASRHRELPRWIAIPGFTAAGALFAFLFLGNAIEGLVNGGGPPPDLGSNRPDVWVSALFEWVAIGAVMVWVGTVSLILLVRDRLSRK
jgi:hypothetical membrane protein